MGGVDRACLADGEGEEIDSVAFDFDVCLVDFVIAGHESLGGFCVAVVDGVEGEFDEFDDELALLDQTRADVVESVFEVLGCDRHGTAVRCMKDRFWG